MTAEVYSDEQINDLVSGKLRLRDISTIVKNLAERKVDGNWEDINDFYWLIQSIKSDKNSTIVPNLLLDLLVKLEGTKLSAENKKLILSIKSDLREHLTLYLNTKDLNFLEKNCASNTMLGKLIDYQVSGMSRLFGKEKTATRRCVENRIFALKASSDYIKFLNLRGVITTKEKSTEHFNLLDQLNTSEKNLENRRHILNKICDNKSGLKKSLIAYLFEKDLQFLQENCAPDTLLGKLIDHQTSRLFKSKETNTRTYVKQRIAYLKYWQPKAPAPAPLQQPVLQAVPILQPSNPPGLTDEENQDEIIRLAKERMAPRIPDDPPPTYEEACRMQFLRKPPTIEEIFGTQTATEVPPYAFDIEAGVKPGALLAQQSTQQSTGVYQAQPATIEINGVQTVVANGITFFQLPVMQKPAQTVSLSNAQLAEFFNTPVPNGELPAPQAPARTPSFA